MSVTATGAARTRPPRRGARDGFGPATSPCAHPTATSRCRGRRSDLIISGGFNIYPREIEEVLLEQPGVREAAVVGASDPVRGEIPIAYLVVTAEFDEAATRGRLATQLASFKLPRGIVRVEALPRTALGKVQKHLLPRWSPAA
jgi:malonyl-CoA/methylmalonyl-CoA synthetase